MIVDKSTCPYRKENEDIVTLGSPNVTIRADPSAVSNGKRVSGESAQLMHGQRSFAWTPPASDGLRVLLEKLPAQKPNQYQREKARHGESISAPKVNP